MTNECQNLCRRESFISDPYFVNINRHINIVQNLSFIEVKVQQKLKSDRLTRKERDRDSEEEGRRHCSLTLDD